MEIKDLDASTIIRAGTLEREGYLTRISHEVLIEINRHGIFPSTGTFLIDNPSPKYSDFTCVYSNKIFTQYTYTTGTRNFYIEKYIPGKSSYISFCGNPNHSATLVIHDCNKGKKYCICQGVMEDSGDFDLIKKYIFFPEEYKLFEHPQDKCLGRILKQITQ